MQIPAWIPPLRKGWMLLVAAFIVFCLITKRSSIQKYNFYLIIYALILAINVIMGDWLIGSFPVAIYEVLMLAVSSGIGLWYIENENKKVIRSILVTTLLFLALEGIASWIIMKTDAGIIRLLYSLDKQAVESGDVGLQYYYFARGLLDYSMAHAIPILIPPLFYYFKRTPILKNKWICVGGIISCVLLTWLSESTTALMLALMMVLIGLLSNLDGIRKNIVKIVIIGVIASPFLFNDNIMLSTLDIAEKVLGDESIFANKIKEFQIAITMDEMTGDLSGRIDRYGKSLNEFLSNPIVGTNRRVGNHAALIDRLAALGIVGFFPLVMFFISYFCVVRKHISKEGKTFYYEGLFAGFLMLTVKGMWVWPMFYCMFIVMPFIIIYVDKFMFSQKMLV